MEKILYGINTKGELSPGLVSMLLTIGISTNICSDGFIMVGTLIAEEKWISFFFIQSEILFTFSGFCSNITSLWLFNNTWYLLSRLYFKQSSCGDPNSTIVPWYNNATLSQSFVAYLHKFGMWKKNE